MATTAKELIEILQKYTDPDDVVIWQYYTRHDFDCDDCQPAPTNEEFAEISDRLERHLWDGLSDEIYEAIYHYQNYNHPDEEGKE
jgi:hypothetical protein